MIVFLFLLISLISILIESIGEVAFSGLLQFFEISIREYAQISSLRNAILFSIVSYPFICSLFSIYGFYKSKNLRGILSKKLTMTLIFFGIIFLNSLVAFGITKFMIILLYGYVYYPVISGVQIVDDSLDPVGADIGLGFGEKVYNIKIYRNGSLILDEVVSDTNDFRMVVLQFQEGDVINYRGRGGNIFGFTVKSPSLYRNIKIQNIGSKLILLVEVERIHPNSPFYYTKLEEGDEIYKIKIFKKELVKVSEKRYSWIETDLRTFSTSNSEDFYQALSFAKEGDYVGLAILHKGYEIVEITKNITDWGIKVRDVTIR